MLRVLGLNLLIYSLPSVDIENGLFMLVLLFCLQKVLLHNIKKGIKYILYRKTF